MAFFLPLAILPLFVRRRAWRDEGVDIRAQSQSGQEHHTHGKAEDPSSQVNLYAKKV